MESRALRPDRARSSVLIRAESVWNPNPRRQGHRCHRFLVETKGFHRGRNPSFLHFFRFRNGIPMQRIAIADGRGEAFAGAGLVSFESGRKALLIPGSSLPPSYLYRDCRMDISMVVNPRSRTALPVPGRGRGLATRASFFENRPFAAWGDMEIGEKESVPPCRQSKG